MKKTIFVWRKKKEFIIITMLRLQMVIYEAARALVNLKNLKSRDLCPAISG